MGTYKKYAKPVMIKKDVYDDLKSYKDTNNLSSFTEAIRELLDWRQKQVFENFLHSLQPEGLTDPGRAKSLDSTYEPEYGQVDVFPPELKRLLKKESG